MTAIPQTRFKDLPLKRQGKVRDIFDFGDTLLLVTTDRLSAFDVVLPDPIPDKGKVLNQISVFWFKKMADIVGNHLVTTDVDAYPDVCRPHRDALYFRIRVEILSKRRPGVRHPAAPGPQRIG